MWGEQLPETLRLLAFAALAAAAGRLWLRRQGDRPALYVVATFGGIFLLLLLDLLLPAGARGPDGLLVRVAPALLMSFPWLLAAFARSFWGPLPSWLRRSGVLVAALSAWSLATAPLGDGSDPRIRTTYLLIFVGTWSGLSLVAAVTLWRRHDAPDSVRARMRLMAAGALVLNVALLGLAFLPPGPVREFGAIWLPTFAAVLFLLGFAAPLPLRLWWRRSSTAGAEQMLAALISARTSQQVSEAVVPLLADLLGTGAAVLTEDGQPLAVEHVGEAELAALRHDIARYGEPGSDVQAYAVDRSWLVVTKSPYSTIFTADEQELIHGFVFQFRLAVERTELFEAEREARMQAERARQDLEATLFGVSHDLRSPAVALTGFAALLAEAEDAEQRREMAGHVRDAAAYVDRLVTALLELSRMGRSDTDRQDLDLTTIARSVIARLEASHPRASLVLDGELPTVHMAPVEAERMFENLLVNALKHGGRDDVTVQIRGRCTDHHAELVVADDGQGVAADQRKAIFGLFHRGGNGVPGSGLGLGLVRRIVEAHDGSVELVPTDVGATFRLRLGCDQRRSTPARVQGRGS